MPRQTVGLGLAAGLACGLAIAAALAQPEAPAAPQPPPARSALEAVARAWEAGDHAALSELVAEEGVEIAITAETGARNHYSGRQAFYFFRNLFRTTETDAFRFSLLREDHDSGLVQAVADWSYRRTGADNQQNERLFLTWKQGDAKWGLIAIRAVR
jgi:hypothetical protein